MHVGLALPRVHRIKSHSVNEYSYDIVAKKELKTGEIKFETDFVTTRKISGKSGAAKDGSRWMNVPRLIIHRPSSSSEYSSFIVPHSEHLQ